MQMRVFARHHHHHNNPWDGAPAWAVELGFIGLAIMERLDTMSKEVDDLTAQVTANTGTINSAIVLINGIADRITAAGVDPAKLTALTTELKAKDDELAAAVTANTPAAP